MIDSKIPAGSLEHKWTDYKGHCKLVNPANKRKLEVIVVGTGLAGASAAAGSRWRCLGAAFGQAGVLEVLCSPAQPLI